MTGPERKEAITDCIGERGREVMITIVRREEGNKERGKKKEENLTN